MNKAPSQGLIGGFCNKIPLFFEKKQIQVWYWQNRDT